MNNRLRIITTMQQPSMLKEDLKHLVLMLPQKWFLTAVIHSATLPGLQSPFTDHPITHVDSVSLTHLAIVLHKCPS